MRKNLLLQGFTSNTYTHEVRWVLATPNIQHAIVSVAFLNEAGILLLEEDLKRVLSQARFYCGVRNGITSYQGLAKLVTNGHRVYTVDTGSRGRIFHPKIYYARGAEVARLSVGSGNLTLGGLHNNIEAGLGIEVDLSNDDDRQFAQDFESQFLTLHEQYPQNVTLANNAEILERMLSAGILVDELEASPPRPSSAADSRPGVHDSVPRIDLPVRLVYPTVRRSRRARELSKARPVTTHSVATNLLRVWQSKPLTERDLTIPSTKATHATGSINLDKGLLDEHIDHRHYFRDEVFPDLDWQPRNSGAVEEARAIFQLVIKGQYVNEHTLAIRHTMSTDSAAYQQRNAMTRLSWGEMKLSIAKPDYIGRTLTLYADESNTRRFVIEID